MKLINLIKLFFKQVFCIHDYKHTANYYLAETESLVAKEYTCKKCNFQTVRGLRNLSLAKKKND